MKFGVPLLVPLLAACGGDKRPVANPPTYSSLEAAVASIPRADTAWHVGTNADCTNPFLKDMVSDNASYQAYEAMTDVNGDGHADHLLALIKGDSGKFYWIPGLEEGFAAPQLFATVDWVREGGFLAQGTTVVFGRFYSDVSETWQWRPATSSLQLVQDDTTTEKYVGCLTCA